MPVKTGTVTQVVAKAVRCRDGVWSLIMRCPYCGRRHQHGGGDDGERPFYGHRLSHCLNKCRDYELIPEGGKYADR